MEKALKLEVNQKGIGIVRIDYPGEKVNILSSGVFMELNDLITSAENDDRIKALIFISAKPDNFIAGADINELEKIRSAKEGAVMSGKAQEIFNRLSHTKIPSIAAINGPCLGGGFELALACTYRIITDDPRTTLALPEVRLGLLPGAGGTQRLPRLIGLQASLDLILTGKNLYPRKAKRIGAVDEVVPGEILMERAIKVAGELIQKKLKIRRPGIRKFSDLLNPRKLLKIPDLIGFLLDSNPLGRKIIFKKAMDALIKQTGGHYPAPEKALVAAVKGRGMNFKRGLELESRLFGELCPTSQSKNLIHIFHSVTSLKKETGVEDKSIRPGVINKVGILGGGLMGSGIATVLADRNFQVRLKDISEDALGSALKYADKYFSELHRKRRINLWEYGSRMDRISVTTDYSGFNHTEIIIEAVLEDINLKHQVLREVEDVVSDDCIFASNTSCISIAEIAKASKHPETIIGMHFFSPVERMPLIEVIVTKDTSDLVTATTVNLGRQMGKNVIVVNDGYGFYTSRSLGPYVNEAIHILFEGGRIDEIDEAMTRFGFPVGPMVLLDEVGIDVVTKVSKIMIDVYGDRMAPPEGWEVILKDNRMGRKNRRGFYTYDQKKKAVDETVYDLLPHGRERMRFPHEEVQSRLVMAFLNEAALCLQQDILRSPGDGDVAAIFGLGFPAFLGGPFRYMDTLGLEKVVSELEKLHQKHGDRFKPANILTEMALNNKKFFK